MKRAVVTLLGVLLVASLTLALRADNPQKLPFAIYEDGLANPPYTSSGWMGNTAAVKVDNKDATKPHTGKTCIKITYSDPDKWAGVRWQNPTNDWGDLVGGYNLTGAKKLTLWARGEGGGEKVKVGFGGIPKDKKFFDTAQGELDLTLTTDWKQYSINVSKMDLTRIKTGFSWFLVGQNAPVTFYLDNIRWE